MREGTIRPNKHAVKRLRTERGWTQDELTRRVGCSKRTIENIEAGKPVFRETLAEVAAAFGPPVRVMDLIECDEHLPGAGYESFNASNGAIGNAPPLPTLLVGREADLARILQRLIRPVHGESHFPTLALTAVRGWPGVGKTSVARTIAHCPEVAVAFPDGVLWTSLGPTPAIMSELVAWGRALRSREVVDAQNVTEATRLLAAQLHDRQMLLIIDDAWEARHCIPFAVGGRRCATLVTTRINRVADAITPTPDDVFRLDVLSDPDALLVLELLAPSVVAIQREACRELVRDLECLPLALQVAGRLLRTEQERGWNVRQLIADLRTDAGALLRAQAPADMALDCEILSPTVAALLQKSTDVLDSVTRKRFAYLAPFAPRPAVFELDDLASVWRVGQDTARETADLLIDRGLLEPVGNGDLQIHQVLVKHARSLLPKKE